MKNEILRMEHISVKKSSGMALSDFRLNVFEGELITVFGFEDSGVQELSEVILGSTIYSAGRVLYCEQELRADKCNLSEQKGVFVIGDDTSILPDFTVAENLFFRDIGNCFRIIANTKQQETFARGILARLDVAIDVKKKGKDLRFYERFVLSLVRAYAQNARLIVFINPPNLADIGHGQEIIQLINKLKQSGISILWIDNHIQGIEEMVDGIFVIRDGKNARTFYHENFSLEEIIRIAENKRNVDMPERHVNRPESSTILELININSRRLNNLNLSIEEGHINGVSSNDPERLEDLRSILCGELQEYRGQMLLKNEKFHPDNYNEAVKKGVQYVDIMKLEKHVISQMNVIDNMLMQSYWLNNSIFGFTHNHQMKYMEAELRKRHRHWHLDSWENLEVWQQKILLMERFLYQPAKICIITEPFIKFNSEMIESALNVFDELISRGKTVVLLSMSIHDLMIACDEITIINKGKNVLTITQEDWLK